MGIDVKIDREQERVQHWRKLYIERSEDEAALLDAVRDARDAITTKRVIRRRLEEDPDFKQNLDDEERELRREELADQIDGFGAELDRLLERIDVKEDKTDKAQRELAQHKRRLDQLRDRRRIIRENRAGRLTPHFHVAEFDCRNGTPVPKHSYDALEVACRIYLEPLREKFGTVFVNSGFRTVAYNASVGGASMSVHIYDAPWQHSPYAVAIDVHCERGTPSQWASFAQNTTKPDGLGRYTVFIHQDNRNRIGWTDAVWNGP